jgi:hypothetical protein
MSDPRDILCELITQHGRDLSEDVARCEAFLRDYCPHERGKVNVLVGAVRERVAADLLSVSSLIPVELQVARLAKRLEDYMGLREDLAKWVVESWALALGVMKPSNLAATERRNQLKGGRSSVIKSSNLLTGEPDELKRTRNAAEQGDVSAQFKLGCQFADGRGLQQNHSEAVKWFLKAAAYGHVDAQNNLGVLYRNGQGVIQNRVEAAKWFRKAADQGKAEAQFNLGHLYANGQGVRQDHVEAVKWFRKAAQQGDVKSQFHLGTCLEMGIGVKRDLDEALKWYCTAAKKGYSRAEQKAGEVQKIIKSKNTSTSKN